jgi:hypothetical protein
MAGNEEKLDVNIISDKEFQICSTKQVFLALIGLILLSVAGMTTAKGKPGGGTDTGPVSMAATGIVDAFQDCQERLSSNSTSFLCNKSGPTHYIQLSDFFLNHPYDNGSGADCFFAFVPGLFPVNIGVNLLKNGSAETVLRFHAFGNDRTTDVLYALTVNDPRGWSGAFPPAAGMTTTMGELDVDTDISWELDATNKRQAKKACVGNGVFESGGSEFIKVDFTRM